MVRRKLLIVLAAVFLSPHARADMVETAGPNFIVGTGQDYTTYYYPTGIESSNLAEYYLYVQGDEDLRDGTYHDQLFMYKNPNTHTGLRSQFAFVKRLLPDSSQGQANSYYYGAPSALKYSNKYYMTVLKSPDAVAFPEQLWGVSSDGVNWTWSRFLYATATDLKIPAVTFQPETIAGVPYFWGFIYFRYPSLGINVGAIRAHIANTATGYDYVEIKSGGVWQRVNADGTFGFVPDSLWRRASDPKLYRSPTGWQLWVTANNNPRVICGCQNSTSSISTAFGDRFWFRTVTVDYVLGPVQNVQSQVRCMPGGYDTSRVGPFRFTDKNGKEVLYSASNDVACLSDFRRQYIVMTTVAPQ